MKNPSSFPAVGALEFALLGASLLLSVGLLLLLGVGYARARDRRLLVPAAISAAFLARALLVALAPYLRLGIRADLTLAVDVAVLGILVVYTLLRRPRPVPAPADPEPGKGV